MMKQKHNVLNSNKVRVDVAYLHKHTVGDARCNLYGWNTGTANGSES